MCSNYQPISILPIISKVFEKLMHQRLYDFIKKILYTWKPVWFPRRKINWTFTFDLHTNIIQSIEKQEKSSCIFLDFAKAFDTVDHYIYFNQKTRTLG